MFKKRNKYIGKSKRHVGEPTMFGDFADKFLLDLARHPHQLEHSVLWENWSIVLGEELAIQVKPIGVRNQTLCIGAEDNMQLQEIRMEYGEILERVNAFMKAFGHNEHFQKLEFSLLQGKSSLTDKKNIPNHLVGAKAPRPKHYGGNIDFKENQSIADCYAEYCNLLDEESEL